MKWTQWMRSRVLNALVAASFTLPMGAPSVFAAYSPSDHLRPSSTDDEAASLRMQADAGWDLSTHVAQLQAEARRRAVELPTLLAEGIAERRGPAGSPASVLDILVSAGRPLTKAEIAREADDRSVRTIEPDLTALRRWGLIVVVDGTGDTARYAVTDAARAAVEQLLPVLRLVGASRDREQWDSIAPQIEAIVSGEARHQRLRTVAAQMAPPTGGVLAADESVSTAGRRLAGVKLENTPENRQAMRRTLLTTPGLRDSGISAVILDRDTLTNMTPDGQTLLVEHLHNQGIITGLKTDEGLDNDPAFPDEAGVKIVKDPGLTKLPALLQTAVARGMGFTKYRTTIRPNDPPETNIVANAKAQARQAKLTQAAGLVPMVEPEVVHDGSDGSPATHDLATSYATTTRVLEATFTALAEEGVAVDSMILKTSMILAGKNAPAQTDPETVGFDTLKGLVKTVPAALPAIVFLSGGQAGEGQATANLDAIIRASQTRFDEARDVAVAELRAEGKTARADEVAALTQAPWAISYSFGRELQGKPLAAWAGQPEHVAAAQAAQLANNREVQRARQGRLQAVGLSVPEGLVPALASHGLSVVQIDAKPLQGQAVSADLLTNRFNAFGLSGSVSEALGSIFFAGRDKVKEIADGNAVFFAETSIQEFVNTHSDVALVVLADEGQRDDSFSLELGTIYVGDQKIRFRSVPELLAKLDEFRQAGITILYYVGDALEKTNGLVAPEAATQATDSNALFSFYIETPETRLGGDNQFLNNDLNRIGGVSFSAPDDAGVTPFDLPSEALPKIAASNARAQGLAEGMPAYDEFIAAYINSTVILTLGPRPARDTKAYEKAVSSHRHQAIINDVRTLQGIYPGLTALFPGDGDLGPRVVASLGVNLDGKHMVVFGRSGSTEARAAMIGVLNSPDARFVHSYVSEKNTGSGYTLENAYRYTDEERARFSQTGVPESVYAAPRATSDIRGTGVLALTSVTGASRGQFGPSFAGEYRRVSVQQDPTGAGTVTTNTILSTPEGNFLVRVVMATDNVAATQGSIKRGIAVARDYWRQQEEDPARHQRLRTVAAQMAPPTGGVLAADESVSTAGRRLAGVKLENTPENRQAMRRTLLTTPGLRDSGISAVILDRDTLTNTTPDGATRLTDHLHTQGILTGLKTDEGLEDDPARPKTGVKIVKDPELTKLAALLDTAVARGMSFTKYRTTIRANDPPEDNLRLNAQAQARHARRSQAAGLVPIVEPEVTHDGSDGSPATHTLAESYAATTRMLARTFEELTAAGAWLDGMVLKTSMILAGKNAPAQTDPETVGFQTLTGLVKTVPTAVPAVVFLSGGQAGEGQATANLDAVIRASQTRFDEARDAAVAELRAEGQDTRADEVAALTQAPWAISYSFGRELQGKPLAAWAGQPEHVAAAQAAQLANNREVQRARQGLLGQPAAEPVPPANSVETAAALLITPDEAASAVDVRDHRWIIVHSSLLHTQGAAAMQEWIAEQVRFVQGEESNRAMHVALAADGVGTQADAEASRVALPESLAATFERAVPAADEEGFASLTSAVAGSRIATIAGPEPFIEAVKVNHPQAVGVVGFPDFGASAIRTAFAVAASSEGRPNPAVAKQLEIAEAGGFFIPTIPVLPEVEAAMRAHQDKLRAVEASSGQA